MHAPRWSLVMGRRRAAWRWLAVAAALGLLRQPTMAQQVASTLTGVVLDSITGRAVESAIVTLTDVRVRARTDTNGAFRLTDVPAGTHELIVAQPGYDFAAFRFTVTDTSARDLDLGPVFLRPIPNPTLVVSGVVRDSDANVPVVGAAIAINGETVAITNANGAFGVPARPGEWGANRLEARRIGYAPVAIDFRVSLPTVVFDIALAMAPVAIQLEPVVVEADRTLLVSPRLAAFHERRKSESGRFFTEEDVERFRPFYTSDLLRHVPGVYIRPGRMGRNVIEVMGGRSIMGECRMAIWVDGALVQQGSGMGGSGLGGGIEWLDMMVLPEHIAGMEVYTRPAQLPARFNAPGSACGAIVVWTR